MHYKLKYRDKVNAQYEGRSSYHTDINAFVMNIQGGLIIHGVVDLSIMPGDRTHYNMRVMWKDKEQKYLHLEYAEGDWVVIIPRYMSPCFLKKHVENKTKRELNPHTAALVCDLANRICESDHQEFYSWEHSCPMYILTESTPNGWEIEEVPCEE